MTVATKDCRSGQVLKEYNMVEHLTLNEVNWQQVNNMILCKKSITDRLSLFEENMSRGSPFYERLHWQLVQQFEHNVSQYTVAQNLVFHCLQYLISLKDSDNLK